MCQWCLLKFWLCHDVSRHLGPENRQIARLFAQWRCSVSMDRYICMGGRPEFHNALTSATFQIWSPTDLPISHRLSSPRQMDRNRYGRIFELNPQMAVVERAWCFLLPSAPLNCMELSELLYCSKNCWPIWVQMSMLPRPWHNFEVKITQLGLVFKSCFYDFQIRKHAASFPHTSGIKCEFSQICQQTTKAFVFKPFFGWDWIVFVDVLTCVHTVSSP
jgi:hypothetical protein